MNRKVMDDLFIEKDAKQSITPGNYSTKQFSYDKKCINEFGTFSNQYYNTNYNDIVDTDSF